MCSLKVKLSPNDHSRKSQRCSKYKENQWNIADMQMEVLWTRRLTFRGCEQFLANDHRKNRELDFQSLGARHHQQPEESGCGFSSKAKVERSDWLLWKQKSLGNSIYSNLISGCKQNSLVEKDIYYFWILICILLVQKVKNLPVKQETQEIPGSGRSPGEGNGISLQYSCLENSMDRGAW